MNEELRWIVRKPYEQPLATQCPKFPLSRHDDYS